ncbi:recombinase family protein [Fictibacillus barbaricus]|uniref:DNA invertase Pin-like site-specific DNA recombinase n=1 Tax=Fictibacillus barbaricus TaxID=182136 RepID=A0ABU1U5B8_9BACL|nr:recombinase family protein [Fictibacillus barbaricus]MDR7074679.1 DNA invertase Pin-like site-specific DNA recombinase [Fictibacillus barbaricus]
MKKTVIYLRQSLNTDKQPHSISMQKDMALEYAEKRDWIIHEVYDEGNRSARKTTLDERPQLKRLLNDVETGKIERILVFKRDRLARKVQQYIEIYRILKKYKVDLHFTADNEPPPFEGAASEFIEAILAGIAEHEANNIVQRLIYSKIPLIKKGLWQVGSPPFAYESKKKKKSDSKEEDEEPIKELKEGESNLRHIPDKVKTVRTLYSEVDAISTDIVDKRDFSFFCKCLKENENLASLTPKQIWDIIVQPLHIGKMVQRLDGNEYSIDNEVTQTLRILTYEEEGLWYKANDIVKQLDVPESITGEKSEDDEGLEEELPMAKLEHVLRCGTCKEPLIAIKKVYKCKTKTCKNAPKINKLDEEVFQRVWAYLIKKGEHQWGKLKEILEKRYGEPFKARITYLDNEISLLENKIKSHFQQLLKYPSEDNQEQLSYLVNCYKEKSKELEKYESLHFHNKQFLNHLDKKETLDLISDINLTEIQKQNILSLVKVVHYHRKKTPDIRCLIPTYRGEK